MARPPYPRYAVISDPVTSPPFPRIAPDPGNIRAKRPPPKPEVEQTIRAARMALKEALQRPSGPFGHEPEWKPGDPFGKLPDLPWGDEHGGLGGYQPRDPRSGGAAGARLATSPLGQAIKQALSQAEWNAMVDFLSRLGAWGPTPGFSPETGFNLQGLGKQWVAGDDGAGGSSSESSSGGEEGGGGGPPSLGVGGPGEGEDTPEYPDKQQREEESPAGYILFALAAAAALWMALQEFLKFPKGGDHPDPYEHPNSIVGYGLEDFPQISAKDINRQLVELLLLGGGRYRGEWVWGGREEGAEGGGGGDGDIDDPATALLGMQPGEWVWNRSGF